MIPLGGLKHIIPCVLYSGKCLNKIDSLCYTSIVLMYTSRDKHPYYSNLFQILKLPWIWIEYNDEFDKRSNTKFVITGGGGGTSGRQHTQQHHHQLQLRRLRARGAEGLQF